MKQSTHAQAHPPLSTPPHRSAGATLHCPLCAEFRPWKLVELALGQGFADIELKEMLGRLQPRLRQLSADDAAGLSAQLQQRAAAVWCGEEAAADELASLAALAASAGGAGGSDQQARQQGQQGEQQQAQQGEHEERQQVGAAAAPAAAQAEAEAPQPKQAKRKRDVFYSRDSRKAALVQKSSEQAAAKGSRAGAAGGAAAAAATPGAQLAGWLADALHALLSTPPTKLPGARLG